MKPLIVSLLSLLLACSAVAQPQTVPRGGLSAAQVTNIINSVTGNFIATFEGVGIGTTISNSMSFTGAASTITFLRRVLPTNGTIVERYHLGDDLGQTFSWQWAVTTNRVALQRQNGDTDFPFMATRVGLKVGSTGTTTTNAGAFYNVGSVGVGTNSPAAAVHVNGGKIVFQQVGTPTAPGGLYHVASAPIANAGNAATNIFTNYIPAHTLTNNGDTVYIELAGQMMNAATTTNRLQVTYGSETVLDTGITSLFSNTVYRIYGAITRSGNTAQIVDIGIEFSGILAGTPYVKTNFVRNAVQTNGIDTKLILQNTCLANGSVTNLVGRLRYNPVP